ncbi:MAG: 50S ribosomal protein L4 [Candidatus Spyradenecus sp.]
MSTIKVYDKTGAVTGEKTVDEAQLVLDRGEQAVKDTVVAILNGYRAGTASTKNKSEVSGTGKKPWKQKGTGRASFGSSRNPVWRGGGVAFGPVPRDYSQKVNKKVSALAFARALSDKIAAGELCVIDSLNFEAPKTKTAAEMFKAMGMTRSCLVIVDDDALAGDANDNFFLSVSNLPEVDVAAAGETDVYMLCRFKNIVVTAKAYEALEARLARVTGKADK